MKSHNRIYSLFSVVGLSLMMGTVALAPMSAAAQGGAHLGRERHPELRRAMRALQNAKSALQQAAHDFNGHRERALDLTQKAIDEVQQAMRSDRH
jgi:hypothetical protein